MIQVVPKNKLANKKILYRAVAAVFFGFFLTISFSWYNSAISAPLLANYYLRWEIPDSEVERLAKWDLLILDMEVQLKSRSQLQRIRMINPDIIILAYVTSQEIRIDANSGSSMMRRRLMSGVDESWYLKRVDGQKISYWPGTNMLNPTDLCPKVNGIKWNDYLAKFAATEILSTGLWNGIFYDNSWGDVRWFTGDNLDLNLDGAKDSDLDNHWRNGMRDLFRETRTFSTKPYWLVGNSFTTQYANDLNGMMIENLQNHKWTDAAYIYKIQSQGQEKPRLIVINSSGGNSAVGQTNYQAMRFGLGTALLKDGYYSYDYGDQNHGQTWWYDEYDVSLGDAVGEARSNSGLAQFQSDVWRRDYTAGLALVNPTDSAQIVDLGADYERLIGTQDPVTNSGLISDRVNLPARDGLLLRKVIQKVENMPFVNGSFVRFFDMKGARKRNGFFAYAEGEPPGAKIFRGDLDGGVGAEKIVASDYRLSIFNHISGIWYNDSPFGDINKKVNFAIGKTELGADKKILFTSYNGGGFLLSTYYGAVGMDPIFPLGKKFRAGFYGALGDVNSDGVGEIVLGTGKGVVGEILILDSHNFKIKKRFFPYDKKNTAGVAVAVGDMNGDGVGEIVTATKSGVNVLVRVFNNAGKKLSEFSGGSMLGGSSVYVSVSDIDNDGREEIMVGSH